MSQDNAPAGGAFLIEPYGGAAIVTPETLDAEARLMARTMEDFLRQEVRPAVDALEAKTEGLMPSLIRKAGALGLLAGSVPERYDGLGLSKSALALLTETAAPYLSFALAMNITSGVALLPLLFFGSGEQKAKYLPRLASGEWIGAFALSESGSGSDALGAQTRAVRSEDGQSYVLNGEKMWITNGAYADLFIIFAQADGGRFTAFLAARDTPGLIVGREEHKLGLHGSSTRRIRLQDARVPVENVLGEVGKGHLSALYALNVGRFSIAALALGGAKKSLRLAAQYSVQRAQFGQPIARFGLVRQKLARMAAQIYALESMLYRVAGYWDARIGAEDGDGGGSESAQESASDAKMERFRLASEEYAIECAILKFAGTEILGSVTDEALQLHGGFGFSEEFPIARQYRDVRVFRIFEGTNEINRLTVLDQLLRRAARGRLDVFATHRQDGGDAAGDAKSAHDKQDGEAGCGIGETVSVMRETLSDLLAVGRRSAGERLGENQLFAASVADMAAALFALESAWLRAEQTGGGELSNALVALWAEDADQSFARAARQAKAALGTNDANSCGEVAFTRFLPDLNALVNYVSDTVTEREGYPL